MNKTLLAASLFTASTLAYAGQPLYSVDYATCMDLSGGITVNMHDCIGTELSIQDTRLNNAYRRLRKALSTERNQQLLNAQRLWIQYRETNCSFYADPDGGTLASLNASECMLRETAERTRELERLHLSHHP